jgi:Methyltransferase domain
MTAIASVFELKKFIKSIPGAMVLMNLPGMRDIRRRILCSKIRKLPDRIFFREYILPGVSRLKPSELLFVGCRDYSESYCQYWRHCGINCWTLDIDPKAARWGVPGRHIVGDVQHVNRLFSPASVDVVIMNGIFGFGINTVEQMNRSLQAVAQAMKPGGLFILGWDTDKIADPLDLQSLKLNFSAINKPDFPPRTTFPSSTHVYDFCIKASASSF